MRKIQQTGLMAAGFLLVNTVLSPAALAWTVTKAAEVPALTADNMPKTLVKQHCAIVINERQTAEHRITVEKVDLDNISDALVSSCTVTTSEWSVSGRNTHGPVQVKYAVLNDYKNQKTKIIQIDEAATREFAKQYMAGILITIKPISVTSEKITYLADMPGQQCTIVVNTNINNFRIDAEPKVESFACSSVNK